jgi:hypothetical protein
MTLGRDIRIISPVKPPIQRELYRSGDLDLANLVSLQALVTLDDLKLHAVTLVQGLKTFRHDRGKVHEHIVPPILRDKPKALLVLEPLHGTCRHRLILFNPWNLPRDFSPKATTEYRKKHKTQQNYLFQTTLHPRQLQTPHSMRFGPYVHAKDVKLPARIFEGRREGDTKPSRGK